MSTPEIKTITPELVAAALSHIFEAALNYSPELFNLPQSREEVALILINQGLTDNLHHEELEHYLWVTSQKWERTEWEQILQQFSSNPVILPED